MKLCLIGIGNNIHLERWASWFVNKGHEVHVITDLPCTIKKVNIHMLKKRDSDKSNFVDFIQRAIQTRKLVKKIKPDIVHAHYACGYGAFGAFANYHPFVVSAWGGDILIDPYESFVKNKMVKYALKKADVVTIWSKYLEKKIYDLDVKIKSLIVVKDRANISNIFYKGYKKESVELRKKLNIPKDTFIVISPRNIALLYRTEIIVKSIPFVLEKYPNVCFIFLKGRANDAYHSKILALIEKLSIKNNVKIISHWLSEKEMATIFNLSDVSVSIPEKDQFAECMEEAIACGTIPIIGKNEIYEEFLKDGENCFFVSGLDTKEIADKIIYCIEHQQIKSDVYKKNKFLIKDFDSQDGPEKIINVYKKLLNENK